MRIILSPAKKMKEDDTPGISYNNLPVFLSEAEQIKSWLESKSFAELKKLRVCNDKIAEENIERLSHMNLTERLTPAILFYDGIAYQYMAPAVFETEMLDYIQEHLRILSGFYGVLRPLDGVTPYRLEMKRFDNRGHPSQVSSDGNPNIGKRESYSANHRCYCRTYCDSLYSRLL